MYDEKISILREIFPDFQIRKGCEFVVFCPSARCQKDYGNDKRKLEINLKDNRFACWRCHYSGTPLRLLKDFGYISHLKRYARAMGLTLGIKQEKERITLPSEYKFVFDGKRSITAARAIQWLKNLNISDEIIFQNRVGYCETGNYRNRIIFPSFDEVGRLNYFVTRHLYDNNEYKWLNCASSAKENIFNELFIDWDKPIILVESVKAYLKHFHKVDNIVCGNGTKISKHHKLFNEIVLRDVPKIFVAFDAEADDEAIIAMNKFHEYGIETRYVQFSGTIQPDEIDTDYFISRINSANKFERIDVLKNRIKKLV